MRVAPALHHDRPMRTSILIPVLALPLVACTTQEMANELPPSGLTFYKDVQPIAQAKCTTCHREGGIAPFSLEDPSEAVRYAELIKGAVVAREMPPWPPGPASPPMLHARTLTDAEIDTIARWVDGGAALGDPAQAGPLRAPEGVVSLAHVDLSTAMPAPYVPDASLTDDYRCFLLPLDVPTTRVATGFRVRPGNAKTVHHVITTLYAGADHAAVLALDGKDGRPGWPCLGGAIPDGIGVSAVGGLGSWVPGMDAVLHPPGTGVVVPAGAFAVMQVHYNLLGGADPDRTSIEVQLASAAEAAGLKRLATLPMRPSGLYLPPETKPIDVVEERAAREWVGGRFFPDGTATIHGVAAHMHLLGTSFAIEVERASGAREVLLDIPRWDFHWQGSYTLATPITIGATDRVRVRCAYDNTTAWRNHVGHPAPMGPVTWGEGTADEMCIGYLLATD